MGLFNKHSNDHDIAPLVGQESTMNSAGNPLAGHPAGLHGGGAFPSNASAGHPHGYANSEVPQNLELPNVPTFSQNQPIREQHPGLTDALHHRADVNDRYAGAERASAAGYGVQMTGNDAGGTVPTNAVGNTPSHQIMHDPSRNAQAPLQEAQPYEETGIGGQAQYTHHPVGHGHQGHHAPGSAIPHHGDHSGTGVQSATLGGPVNATRTSGDNNLPVTGEGARAELRDAKKDATIGNIQMLAGKILSSQSMQAKGQAKVDRADELKAQAEHLGEAERLEADAQEHRRLAQSGDISNTRFGQPGSTAGQRQRNIA